MKRQRPQTPDAMKAAAIALVLRMIGIAKRNGRRHAGGWRTSMYAARVWTLEDVKNGLGKL